MQWYYWLVVIGVLVVFYVMMIARQKRQEKQNLETLNSFKVGDKVVTHIGIYGKIKRIYNTTYGKVCVLEVGVNNKVDIEVDLRYLAAIDEKTVAPEEPVKQAETKNDEPKAEPKEEPAKQPKAEKKSTKSNSTKSKK